MRTVTKSRFELIKRACPGASIETRDGVECAVIPTYDASTDTDGETVMRLVQDDRSFKIGDIITDTNGNTFQIMNPAALIPVRKGPITELGD